MARRTERAGENTTFQIGSGRHFGAPPNDRIENHRARTNHRTCTKNGLLHNRTRFDKRSGMNRWSQCQGMMCRQIGTAVPQIQPIPIIKDHSPEQPPFGKMKKCGNHRDNIPIRDHLDESRINAVDTAEYMGAWRNSKRVSHIDDSLRSRIEGHSLLRPGRSQCKRGRQPGLEVGFQQFLNRQRRKNVTIVHQQRSILDPGTDIPEAPTGIQQFGFVKKGTRCPAKLRALLKTTPLLGQVVGIDRKPIDPDLPAGLNRPADQRLVKQGDQWFRDMIG